MSIKAAVGIVLNNQKQILVGICTHGDDRKGLLTFPGGKLDENEEFDKAAIREVWEETGLLTKNRNKYLIFHDKPNIRFYILDYISGEIHPNEEFENLFFDSPENLINNPKLYPSNKNIITFLINHKLI